MKLKRKESRRFLDQGSITQTRTSSFPSFFSLSCSPFNLTLHLTFVFRKSEFSLVPHYLETHPKPPTSNVNTHLQYQFKVHPNFKEKHEIFLSPSVPILQIQQEGPFGVLVILVSTHQQGQLGPLGLKLSTSY